MSTAQVSVIIPCHNYADYLPASIDSALRQAGVAVEVVVVDDASSDGSADVADSFVDPRVTVVRRSSNGGPVVTFNQGLTYARGDYLVRLDADDLLTPGSLERSVALLEMYPRTSFAYGRPWHFAGEPPNVPAPHRTAWRLWSGRAWLGRRFRTGVNCITSPEVVMRHSAVRAVGGQRVDLEQTHDMEMWMRLATAGDVGYISGPIQALHREHGRSRSATQVDPLIDLRERATAFRALVEGDHAQEWMQGAWLRVRYVLAREALERVIRAYDRGRAGTEPIDEYLVLARELWDPIESHGRWRATQSRVSAGSRAQWNPAFQAGAAHRRAREEFAHLTWVHSGV